MRTSNFQQFLQGLALYAVFTGIIIYLISIQWNPLGDEYYYVEEDYETRVYQKTYDFQIDYKDYSYLPIETQVIIDTLILEGQGYVFYDTLIDNTLYFYDVRLSDLDAPTWQELSENAKALTKEASYLDYKARKGALLYYQGLATNLESAFESDRYHVHHAYCIFKAYYQRQRYVYQEPGFSVYDEEETHMKGMGLNWMASEEEKL